jgi:hypothetical protein
LVVERDESRRRSLGKKEKEERRVKAGNECSGKRNGCWLISRLLFLSSASSSTIAAQPAKGSRLTTNSLRLPGAPLVDTFPKLRL